MNDQIAAAAQSVLSDSLSYVLTLLFIQVFVVFQMFWHGSGDYAVRRRFVALLFLPFVVMVVIMLVFIFSHLEDMLRIGHARPRWELYISTLGITAVAAAFIGWNHLGESRRPYSIANTSEETALAAGHYRQPIIMELKGAVVWILASILAAGCWIRPAVAKRELLIAFSLSPQR